MQPLFTLVWTASCTSFSIVDGESVLVFFWSLTSDIPVTYAAFADKVIQMAGLTGP
jgi:hypothetical protein